MLVAGVDSSTQSCKLLVIDCETGLVVRQSSVRHPEGTSVDPGAWWVALKQAISNVGGLGDVSAIGIGGQQHGMVLLNRSGEVVRDALLWNDTSSAPQAQNLVDLYGSDWWSNEVGSVPVASFTVTKLAWVCMNDLDSREKTEAVCLPHDYLTFMLKGGVQLVNEIGLENVLTTDRGDASGTGYWSLQSEIYLDDLVKESFGKSLILPKVLGPWEQSGKVHPVIAKELNINPECLISAGSGDNMAAALGLGARPGHGIISLGTSGTVFASSESASHDSSGLVAGFADATGNYLPLACTLNATQVFDVFRKMLKVDYQNFDELALAANPGADGLTLVPFLQGERTPNLPNSTGSLSGIKLENLRPENLARAAIEGVICSLNDALQSIKRLGVEIDSLSLIGGGAASKATQLIASSVLGQAIQVPPPAEYVAIGMAKQAAKTLNQKFEDAIANESAVISAEPSKEVFENYKEYLDKVY